MRSSKSFTSVNRPCVMMGIVSSVPFSAGSRPIVPAGKSRFCSRTTLAISVGSEAELSHPNRIENQSHGIVLLAEDEGITHARQSFEIIDDT